MAKKETRIMKVTLDEDEFKKFDSGETHSDNGIRNDKGKLSALPDIAPISNDELPYREVVRTEYVPIENDEPPVGKKIAGVILDVAADILSDPEVQEAISFFFKELWHYKVKPKIKEIVNKSKGNNEDNKSVQLSTDKMAKRVETGESKPSISSDEAVLILQEMRKKAQELAAMITFISNVSIKDEKTQEEYTLEKEYVNFLITEEAKKTMEFFTNNPMFSDKETVQQFSECLQGYVSNGNKKIPLYLKHENDNLEN